MEIKFDVSKLTANMDAIRTHMAQKGVARAVRKGAEVIGAAMEENAPVLDAKTPGSDSLDPGDLKANIHVRSRTEDGQPVALVGPSGKQGRIGKVAHLVEYGHRQVTGGKSRLGADGKYHGGGKVHEVDVPAYPFLRPAYEGSQAAALTAVGAELGEQLGEAARNGK